MQVDQQERLPALQMPAYHRDDRGIGWRVTVLPHLEEQMLFDLFSDPSRWKVKRVDEVESMTQRQIPVAQVAAFVCPSNTPQPTTSPLIANAKTDEILFQGIAGRNSIAPAFVYKPDLDVVSAGVWWGRKTFAHPRGARPRSKEYVAHQMLAIRSGAKLSFVVDGLSNTILLSENDTPMNWLFWEDYIPGRNYWFGQLIFFDSSHSIGVKSSSVISANHDGANVALCDGSVRFLAETVSTDVLYSFFSRDEHQVAGMQYP